MTYAWLENGHVMGGIVFWSPWGNGLMYSGSISSVSVS